MDITNEDEAERAYSLIYRFQEEAIQVAAALTEWAGGDPYEVFEVDCISLRGQRRAFIIREILGTIEEELEELADNHPTHIRWMKNPFTLVTSLVYDAETDHLAQCQSILTQCPACSSAFNIKEFLS